MRYSACEGTIKAGDTPTTVGQVTGWSKEETANIKKFFNLGNCDEQSAPGGISRTVSIQAQFDPTDAGQSEFAIGGVVAVKIYPIGETTGNILYDITGIVESISESGSGDEYITRDISISVNTYTESTTP